MAFLSSMSKTPPNLELLYDQVLEFDSNQPNDYLESIVSYLSDNSPQIRNVLDNLLGVFANNPSMSNAFRLIFFIIVRIGSPSFFSLECSKIPETNLDPSTQHEELVELKRITKYCVEKFQKMQTIHELPNIGHKYTDLCQIVEDDPQIPDISLTEFEKQYSELSIKFQQIAQTLETIVSENKQNSETLDQGRVVQLLEQIDGLTIQPDQRFTKAENELVLNFFHQRYALINRVHNGFPQILEDYQQKKEQKKTQKPKEKEEDSHNENKQIQELQIQSIKDFMYFVEGTSLAAFPESMTLEYKDYIFPFSNEIVRQKLKNTICAFLNTNGGRILIGVGNDGYRVKGLFLTSNDQDDLIRDIDDLLKDFHPKVEAEEVITTFIPVKKKDSSYKPGFYVVKILVKRGKPNELYFTGKNCFKRRNGLNEYQTAAYFKKDIIERAAITIVSHPDLFKDKGEFNDALPELGIPVTNVKSKRIVLLL